MAELRHSVQPRWVIVSSARGNRPHDVSSDHSGSDGGNHSGGNHSCPFCRNHEHETGDETFAFRESDVVSAPDWSVRVVYNKFPAVDSSLSPTCTIDEDCHRSRRSGFGSHEVVVETPEHGIQFAELPIDQVERVLKAFRHRLKDLKNDKRFQYVQVFKNNGKEAGASLRHSHSQIIALPMVPQELMWQVKNSKEFFERKGRCLLCESVKADLRDRSRLIDQSSRFVSVAPFEARFPFETWIIPINHSSNFEGTSDSEIGDLARLLHLTLKKIVQQFPGAAYNYVLYNNPFCEETKTEYFHWYIAILPRLGVLGGFELATGWTINTVAPEKAAQTLRECVLK
ncbi:hypothetical protein SELMODRAFT_74004 [Selaginella moellendorffii]|uniref:Uncharacterized protein n=1 Tax=Selaginella moellendorffii TaxID=88036 RepID=D8QPF9_SELML|nr:ADP-glucose phosphorylase [Selaginella moellendorffii]XP_024524568.1 ADP-glucose phosphorylase [Selaginella moellendorffii]XP_024524574.1 ADP-glucose phosphorylase [Selaginella moellendorffii]XP_024524586.1 ADP-glucose phosphorylase [Selaginella moellendorffii]XP_024524593.1 ADP-glucose phosphorylase [Selaginella moellendorffii]XP_024524601.1 ADP-glucose phosphorylase [Selaginella moellendorffii]EFJ38273.1 hypothetical protein SELMODRAFT_74004 [Selaginella moellendorffii]|eukprot:XP_002960734.1 ADP-glucose phosphorylase [Selaginella moellendorffii]